MSFNDKDNIYTNDGVDRILLSGTYNGYAFSIQTTSHYPIVYVQFIEPNSVTDFFESDLTDLCNIYVPAHMGLHGLIDDYIYVGMAFDDDDDYVCGGENAHGGIPHDLDELEFFARELINMQMKGVIYES